MELKDTVEGMLSDDWKERLKAEFFQVDIRIQKLDSAIRKMTKMRKATGDAPIALIFYRKQIRHMKHYRETLRYRAEIHGVDLNV